MIRPAPSLSVVIPLFNEQDNVAPLVLRVHQALNDFGGRWELLLVDDGSRDATHLHLCEAATRVTVLTFGSCAWAATSDKPPPCRPASTPPAAS